MKMWKVPRQTNGQKTTASFQKSLIWCLSLNRIGFFKKYLPFVLPCTDVVLVMLYVIPSSTQLIVSLKLWRCSITQVKPLGIPDEKFNNNHC